MLPSHLKFAWRKGIKGQFVKSKILLNICTINNPVRITLFSIALSANCFFSHAQNIRYPVAAAYTQLQTYSSVATNPFSFTSNQAKLASGKMISAGFFAEKRFLLSDLSFYSAAFILPSNSGGFGLNADYFGSSEYNESQIGLAYGRVINNKID